jgi:hypothetical protein
MNAMFGKPQKIRPSRFKVGEIDNDVDLGIEERLTIGSHLERLVTPGDLTHSKAGVLRVYRSNKLEPRVAIDRAAHRASHLSTSTEDSDSQRHESKLAAGEPFKCSRSISEGSNRRDGAWGTKHPADD